MTEAVEILIKADDEASAKFSQVSNNVNAAGKQINAAFKDTSRTTKGVAELAAVLANLTGNSELASFASQMASSTEKVSQFSEVAKKGGAGALAFKLGLIGLAAGAGFALGKWLADMVWQTEAFERSMASAKEEAKRLDDQIKQLAQTQFANQREDIELIRDPDAKRAAYQKLFGDLQRDIATASAVAQKSKRDAEEWANAWQITGDRKQYAEDAKNQAEADRQRVDALKAQAAEIGKLIGQRAQENELIRAANAAKDKSESYLAGLQQEVEYLKATREEQIALDAARNTTAEDRGEAERLLKERDAIQAKIEAEKELAQVQRKAQEDAARAAEKAKEDAAREQQKVTDLVEAERQRLEIRRIELEQGKEAAKIQQLINQGVDAATARKLAAEESALDLLSEQKNKKGGGVSAEKPQLSATEGRLLTRGPGSKTDETLERIARSMTELVAETTTIATTTYETKGVQEQIASNTSKTTQLVPTS